MLSALFLSFLSANAVIVTETNYVTEVENVFLDSNNNPTATITTNVDLFDTAAQVETSSAAVISEQVKNNLIETSEDAPSYTVSSLTQETTTQALAETTSQAKETQTQSQSDSSSGSSDQSSSNSGPSSSQDFSGQATYYDVGLGACGVTNTNSELIAAMNVDQFGSQSNGNPICGKQATLYYQGKSVTVTVQDKCPGCSYGDIDLSPAAFQALADESLGRIPITWHFN